MASSWQSGRAVWNWGGRVACVPTKTAISADRLGREAMVAPGVLSDGMSRRKCEETVEVLCGRCGQRRKRLYKAASRVVDGIGYTLCRWIDRGRTAAGHDALCLDRRAARASRKRALNIRIDSVLADRSSRPKWMGRTRLGPREAQQFAAGGRQAYIRQCRGGKRMTG